MARLAAGKTMPRRQAQIDRVSSSIQERCDPDPMQVVSHRHRENGKRRMNNQHEPIVNIPLALLFFSSPWSIALLEEFSCVSAKVLPILGVLQAVLQIWYMFRKHKHLKGDKDSK